jgi:hypothetical protein
LRYPLSVYLEGLNEGFWQGPQDTPGLVNALLKAIAGEALNYPDNPGKRTNADTGWLLPSLATAYPAPLPFAQPPLIEMPEGTMDPQSFFYVERGTDRVALETIQRQGVTITIKGPRQMGKSSLLLRVQEAARQAGKRVAFSTFNSLIKPP